MTLIAMAVYSTEDNKKDQCLAYTLTSLMHSVDWSKHRLVLSVNSATNMTRDIFNNHERIISDVIWNDKNLGTAEAINKAWRTRNQLEHAVKMDDDVVIHMDGWLDELTAIANSSVYIGQVALKRKDLIEYPDHADSNFRSTLRMLPHEPGEPWRVVEEVRHCMGTCVLHSYRLLDRIGYMIQPGLYGFDDVLMSLRSRLALFHNVFVPHIEIDHIDDGKTHFQQWKGKQASDGWPLYQQMANEFQSGKRVLYYNPFESED